MIWLFTTASLAGGMFHGVRCGAGDDVAAAVAQLNERISTFEGLAGTYHHDLALHVRADGKALACVLVNRHDWIRDEPEGKPKAHCLTGSWESFVESTHGRPIPDANSRALWHLSLSEGAEGTINACALSYAQAKGAP